MDTNWYTTTISGNIWIIGNVTHGTDIVKKFRISISNFWAMEVQI